MKVAMTVDVEARDHPCQPGNFRSMVDAYVASGAPATLFVQGGWALSRATDDELTALGADRMVVGLHGHTHRRFTELGQGEIVSELDAAEAALVDVGAEPLRPLFRLPYLAGNTDGYVLQAVAAHGWWHIDCHAVSYDWRDDLRHDPGRVAEHAIRDIERRRAEGAGCAIVLFHSWPDPAPEATRRVLDHCRSHDDDLVAVTDLPRREWNVPVVL
jgi:peptidoglycan/xylan/chitin deacetylase (PgdA/CDA1 family)